MKDRESLDETFRHYRNSAIYLSATIVVVSGFLLQRLESAAFSSAHPLAIVLSQLVLFAAIGCALALQYLHYRGSRNKSQADLWLYAAEEEEMKLPWLE